MPKMNSMNEFGEIVVVIRDEAEFRRRIRKAAENIEFDCVFGDVNYHPATDRGKFVEGNMLHLIRRDEIHINELVSEKNIVEHYDCFDKWDKNAYQREWRICLNRGLKESGPYRLEIGSISDIAFVVPVMMLYPALYKWLGSITAENPLLYLPRYDGTVTRDKFKMNVHNLRPNKGYLLTTIM